MLFYCRPTVCLLVVALMCSTISCAPPSVALVVPPTDTAAVEVQIASAFGTVERNPEGIVVGIDLARERASADDSVLRASLSIPNLKRFRFAGGSVSADSLVGLKTQHELEELFLQDIPIHDAQWEAILDGLPQLSRLTLRRLSNLSGPQLGTLPNRLTSLRNLAFIEMEVTGESLAEIAKSKHLVALDVRNCSRLTTEDYRCLSLMPKLADLKIGGFAITDDTLTAIASLRLLRGLTIEDSLLTPEGIKDFTTEFASADKLETLVLSRNMALFDDALVDLKKFPNLKRLTVNDMMVTGTFLEHWVEDEATRPKLQRLSLRKAFLSEEGAAALKKYPELRVLDLSGVSITPELIDIVVSLNHLEELDVTDCELDEDTLGRLQSMPSLKRLGR